MNSCVPHRVILGLLAFALCCIVDFGPCLLVCPGSSVGRALCLDCRVSWVRVPPSAAHFCKKGVVLGAAGLFALHLCYLLPHYDSCSLQFTWHTKMSPRQIRRIFTDELSTLTKYCVTLDFHEDVHPKKKFHGARLIPFAIRAAIDGIADR